MNSGLNTAGQAPSCNDDIAVVGMAGRFPGAADYRQFWKNLEQTVCSVGEILPERWDWRNYWGDPKNSANTSGSKWAGMIDQADCFDAGFFKISGTEARTMDPQQRIMLELSWACLEDAGIRPSSLSGSDTAVYLGVFNFDYKELQERVKDFPIEAHHSTGTAAAIIPNRVSYFFNFTGPSVPVDTACSSSLHAIHLAMQSIRQGECKMALAGGISLLLTPTRHISFSKTGMLSPTGTSKSFDQDADGYARSEGAGVLLLKTLSQALADGDHIYGILKGSAVNHGGKNHTLTYPGEAAQAAVISQAILRAGIAADTINYVEAHGTGTPKGDPIEYRGLVKAFTATAGQPLSPDSCALGSVKANIGHLESAAGVAGVIKVLLALQHGKLPGQPNFHQLNPAIDTSGSPFFVVAGTQEWKALVDAQGEPLPRRAGVSSFGFGGTNSHVIVEEAPAVLPVAGGTLSCYPVCLSAKTTIALEQRIRDLYGWLQEMPPQVSLRDIAFTLAAGREHFAHRALVIATDTDNLKTILAAYLENGTAADFIKGVADYQTVAATEDTSGFTLEHEGNGYFKGELLLLGERYVRGEMFRWEQLFSGKEAKRIALPVYPFARERHWITTETPVASAMPHLIRRNLSAFAPQCYSGSFSGEEVFLRDHVIGGKIIFPGVVYLEMAREAAVKAWEASPTAPVYLENIVWIQPFQPDGTPQELFVELSGSHTAVNVSFFTGSQQAQNIVAQGTVLAGSKEVVTPGVTAIPPAAEVIAGDTFYQQMEQAGFAYGPAFRAITTLYVQDDTVWATLARPGDAATKLTAFTWHPGILDAALQAAVTLFAGVRNTQGLSDNMFLPFALDGLYIHNRREPSRLVVRKNKTADFSQNRYRADIIYYDDKGEVCMQLIGFTARQVKPAKAPVTPQANTLLLQPAWVPAIVTVPAERQYVREALLLAADSPAYVAEIQQLWPRWEVFTLTTAALAPAEIFGVYANRLLACLQQLIKEKPEGNTLLQVVIPVPEAQPFLWGLSGMLDTAAIEYPWLTVQLLGMERVPAIGSMARLLQAARDVGKPGCFRAADNGWQIRKWEIISPAATPVVPWKAEGIYLITGGSGALGRLFAHEITRAAATATVILTGRSAVPAEEVNRLAAAGARIVYRQTDVSNAAAVTALMEWINTTYGRLDGILHAAGLLQDNYLIKKTPAELEAVLAPKVRGLLHIDTASAHFKLDFVLLCASFTGALGNAGQADYAAANAFMDAFAGWRNYEVKNGRRQGTTISLDWPLWEEGGMNMAPVVQKQLYDKTGLKAIDTRAAMTVLYAAMAYPVSQVLVLAGDTDKLQQTILQPVLASKNDTIMATDTRTAQTAPVNDSQPDTLLQELTAHAARLLAIPAENIEPQVVLDDYGFDSILYTQLAEELSKTYDRQITPPLFFEYNTLAAIAGYLQGAGTNAVTNDTITPMAIRTAEVPPVKEVPSDTLLQALTAHAARLLAIPAENIEPQVVLDDYGFDSILYTQLAEELSKTYDRQITPPLFFEYNTLAAIAGYLQGAGTNAVTNDTIIPMATRTAPPPVKESLSDTLLEELTAYAARLLAIPAENIESQVILDDYGFDSILYTQLAEELSKAYGQQITPPLFFEYNTLAAIANYLRSNGVHAAAATDRGTPADIRTEKVSPVKQHPSDTLLQQLTNHAARLLEIPAGEMAPDVALHDYGFDSILYGQFADELNNIHTKKVTPPLFLKYKTLAALAAYLSAGEAQPATVNGHTTPIDTPADRAVTATPSWERVWEEGEVPVAIIGMSAHLPMAGDVHQFWKNLQEGKDCITQMPQERKVKGEEDKNWWGGFIDDLYAFDPEFFGLFPAEAAYIDPQQRLLMMEAWKAIEDAGYAPRSLAGSQTAVFAGVSAHEYSNFLARIGVKAKGYTAPAMVASVGPNRISYLLDLHGPSEPVDTACSSGLVAVLRAVESLRNGNCDMALAGGVNALQSTDFFISYSKAGMLSEDGRCKTFSDKANGYVRSEGAGMICLKRLADAERDGDHIYGIILAGAENHGGRANSLTAPNVKAQAAVLKTAYTRARIDPRTITYLEAHGTGTALGDPVEINALKAAFEELYAAGGYPMPQTPHCGIGAVKSSIGHLEYAAGIAGIIKVLLQLQHRQIVKNIHCQYLNPYIRLTDSPFYIVQESKPWETIHDATGLPLPARAGVSSFGFGGVNAHVVLEEYPRPVYRVSTSPVLIVLSARNREQLRDKVTQLLAAIDSGRYTDAMLTSIAYTLQTGRDTMDIRIAVCVNSLAMLKEKFTTWLMVGDSAAGIHTGESVLSPGRRAKSAATVAAGATNDLEGLAAHWVKEGQADWQALYTGKQQRISLPAYPFAKEYCYPQPEISTPVRQEAPATPGAGLREPASRSSVTLPALIQLLTKEVAGMLGIATHELDAGVSLEDYGFDSIRFTQFADQLNEKYQLQLTPTVFFNYPDIDQLAGYLLAHYPGAFTSSAATAQL
ncbi:SDR family NAD(P)-dependent oxidoreductase [Chitinophaga nivalis]|uniref:SDR family NAD(P)-dependent oxidoreductase n=1 Tax=Chitinophaga nivalis TaxID=2991709 RepID=A0ABT3IJD2_9BACT|nr:SDR family NAD(P)-dependent oxidoreductase [Chitinophaga nivalis]MCW3466236.1 SDR family NAD(P)-dependent oxidoreductase [Chitinophaga nivalis]MCW3484073.1 SDR family NAD(P)-dependent oxidoreductase [Chitinophaga nivalis]